MDDALYRLFPALAMGVAGRGDVAVAVAVNPARRRAGAGRRRARPPARRLFDKRLFEPTVQTAVSAYRRKVVPRVKAAFRPALPRPRQRAPSADDEGPRPPFRPCNPREASRAIAVPPAYMPQPEDAVVLTKQLVQEAQEAEAARRMGPAFRPSSSRATSRGGRGGRRARPATVGRPVTVGGMGLDGLAGTGPVGAPGSQSRSPGFRSGFRSAAAGSRSASAGSRAAGSRAAGSRSGRSPRSARSPRGATELVGSEEQAVAEQAPPASAEQQKQEEQMEDMRD